ncbi:hypothetical protein GPA10_37660 [Streptomyces sp. p1417]|uniref:Secreted protein n=1 Tax=Streptomyces typhae TaxID=2681492 RepID=A0A6L6X935_9ACTN|nr:hypothetical protein [Streptomyces typhae]MVO90326.1 hypothetical protein [Streptomyces typhae]
MQTTSKYVSAFAAVALGTGALLGTTVSTASAAGDGANRETGTSAATARGSVHGGNSIWEKVSPFHNKLGTTWHPSQGFEASCKRWADDDKWWYWVKLDGSGLRGHIPGDQTNLRHSHLPKCG